MKKTISLIALCLLTLNIHAATEAVKDEAKPKVNYHNDAQIDKSKPFYYGIAQEVLHGGAYTYVNVQEDTKKTFWIVVENADVKVGDIIRFKKQLVAKNFKSKELKKSFDEIMFADNLEYKEQEK